MGYVSALAVLFVFLGGGVGANYSSSISHLSWMFLFPRPKHGHVEESELAADWNVVSKEKRLHILSSNK